MHVAVPASRVLAGFALSAITILVWEACKSLVYFRGDHCEVDASPIWRWKAELQLQLGNDSVNEHVTAEVESDPLVGESAERLVHGHRQGDSSSTLRHRQCLVRAFEHGTKSYEWDLYSKLGEDGIIHQLWRCVAPQYKTYIEIGAADGWQCSTRQLRERGWTGLLLGSGPANKSINLHTASPTGDDVVAELEAAAAPEELDLLAVQAGLHTFWVVHAALRGGYRPLVIAAHINGHFHPADAFVAPHTPDKQSNGSAASGAAAGAFAMLFSANGYSVVAINQAQSTIFAVSSALIGRARLFSMEQITAGLTETPLCQGAPDCGGVSEWLEVTEAVAPALSAPRDLWYDRLPLWAVRCARVTRPWGRGQVQWGEPGAVDGLPDFKPGVIALLPCMRVAEVTAMAAEIVAAQPGPANNGTAERAAGNMTDCARRPEAQESVDRKRACLLGAFKGGSSGLEGRRYSQAGEDGVIDAIFGCILTHDKFYVEFGVESGDECTTRHLREDGWTGLLMDGGFHRPEINLQQEFFNAEGIAYQFRAHAVPLRFDHLTIDIDQNTFWVLHAVLLAGYRPRAIVAEINRNFHPADAFTVPYTHDKMWDQSGDFGASAGAYDALFAAFGYHTLALDQDQINIYAVQSCEVGPERLFSMDEVTAGLTRHGPCLGLHFCNNADYLQIDGTVAEMLTRPRGEWYDLMPRWRIVCSELPGAPERQVRILTGLQLNGSEPLVVVPRLLPSALTPDACAPVKQATAAAAGGPAASRPRSSEE